eukprot:CAMPEP_0182903224 /NCGR_PEP_ID=MMETSP0034_2-20130328/31098_1 /TAXON_ID=156128 /ORGANISM="Nephroselmis pyriformis, Strain CCMP717" /LENGTH=73 /DNA_ID=CAMNT_0025038049 /DNA_START=210 /DNA_END=427 /DNA_ORIENTATION=-
MSIACSARRHRDSAGSAADAGLERALTSLELEGGARAEVLGSPDLLERIAAQVDEDDLLVWSLVCRGFRGAQR